jgi:exodeoxyribonuclease V alpha subunit
MSGTPIQWDSKQQEAIDACCDVTKRLVAVTGAAGTGKTRLLDAIANKLIGYGYSVQTSAPTGKAAKRIKEATGLEAMTNHRMLGYGMPTEVDDVTVDGKKRKIMLSTGPKFGRELPLPFDTILCDEYAMVNVEIHRNLIDALKRGARLCMFGDANQLKPIEENKQLDERPSSFQEMLRRFSGIVLETNHRQDEGSGITSNGVLILAGRMPKRNDDFAITVTDTPVDVIRKHVSDAFDSGISYASVDNQIITGMNKSWIGTRRMNLVIQSMFWDRTLPYIELPRWKSDNDNPPIRVQVGSKVVNTANGYDLGNGDSVFNGELGIVNQIDFEYGNIEVDFGDRCVIIPPLVVVPKSNGRFIEFDPRKNIDLGYVLTTHKCQGSEYQHVTYCMNKSTGWTQSRRNFYTGITRARKHCTVITDMYSITKSTKFPG